MGVQSLSTLATVVMEGYAKGSPLYFNRNTNLLRTLHQSMAVNLNPKIGEESCMKCNEKIGFAMYAFDGSNITFDYNFEDDKQFKIKGWVCYNCALENDWLDGTSLEGARVWCVCCKEILCWNDGNGCVWCAVPCNEYGNLTDDVFCDKCWNDDNLETFHNDGNGSLASIHNECDNDY